MNGVITANILKGLGVDKIEIPIEQYLFNMPIDTWCDLCFFHALGDRVGMYVGENWGDVPYEPLRAVAPQREGGQNLAQLGMLVAEAYGQEIEQRRHRPRMMPQPIERAARPCAMLGAWDERRARA